MSLNGSPCPSAGITDGAADGDPSWDEQPTITPYADGPLIVRGSFRLTTPDGTMIDPGRRTVALCRCGRSGRKPFCDGSHGPARFRAPAGDGREAGAPAR
jgi:CDGSH-type Zn-finger protein